MIAARTHGRPGIGMEMVQFQRGFLATLIPPRTWPVVALTFLGPVAVGLSLHALIQLDRRMYALAVVLGAVALAVGSLPAVVGEAPEGSHRVRIRAAGERRGLILFLLAALVTLFAWSVQPARLAVGLFAVVVGGVYVWSITSRSAGPWDHRSKGAKAIPWCYVLGPSGAIALAALAMRPEHLGSWREIVYLSLGRVAAVAAIVFFVLLERELRRRSGRTPIPDRFLPYRILTLLLALTGLLVPGGGTPFAVSWAIAWLIAATFERRLAMTNGTS